MDYSFLGSTCREEGAPLSRGASKQWWVFMQALAALASTPTDEVHTHAP